MDIRSKPIGFAECDTFDEVCGFVNKIYDILRENRTRIEALEAKSKRKAKSKTETNSEK